MPNLAPLDRGVRLVFQTDSCEYDDDPSMPFQVSICLRPPEFMLVTWVMLHGGAEKIIARAETLAWAEDFITREKLETHPRFMSLVILGPNGVVRERKR